MEEDKESVPPETNDEIHGEFQEQEQEEQALFPPSDEIQEQEQDEQAQFPPSDEIQEQEQDEQALFPPNEVTNNSTKVKYSIQELIGTSCHGAIQVYRATYFLTNVHKLSVALKLIRADQESQDYKNLVKRVERNQRNYHPNIMGIAADFTENGIYCVDFPYMDYGPLRSIMRSQFPDGIPLVYVVVALKEALRGLHFLHDRGQAHREISAGQIFFSKIPQIRLSFSGSAYDHGLDQDNDDPHYLSVKSISKWASAPEVYDSQNDELYDSRADIWMIGITALELAYGEVKIRSRDHLMSIVDKIKDERKTLPLREDEQSPSPSTRSFFVAWVDHITENFKVSFDKFVCRCLATDPANRPTVCDLLNSTLFTTMKKGVIPFRDFVSQNTNQK